MLLLIVFVLLIILGIVYDHSNIIGVVIALFLWVLFGWSYGNADYENYFYKYSNLDSLNNSFEYFYISVQKFAQGLGMSYRVFLIILAAVFTITLIYVTKKLTNNWPFVLALYSVYPFMMDVVQIRNSMALIFVWIGISNLFDNEYSKKNIIIFIFFISIATFFHSMSFIYFILLFAIVFDEKKLRLIIGSLILLLYFGSAYTYKIVYEFAKFINMEKRIILYINDMNNGINLRKTVIIISLFALFSVIIKIIKNNTKTRESVGLSKLELMSKINLSLLLILPLCNIMPDIYRSLMGISIFNYILWAKALQGERKRFKIFKVDLIIKLLGTAASLTNIFIIVLSSTNYNTVFVPLFYQNQFF